MKSDIPKLKALMEGMDNFTMVRTIGTIGADVVQFGIAMEVAKNFENMIPGFV